MWQEAQQYTSKDRNEGDLMDVNNVVLKIFKSATFVCL